MLRIRLSRVGKRKQPSYRLVVTDSRAPRDGAFIKILGHYNPRTEPTTLVVKEDEAIEWLRRGAQPSDTAAKLLTRIGVMERAGKDPVVWDRKTPVKPKKAAEEGAPAATAAAATKEAPAKAEAAEEATAEPEAPAEEAATEETPAKAEAPDEATAEPEAPAEEAATAAESTEEEATDTEGAEAKEPEPEPEPEAPRPKAKPKKTAKRRSDP